jgi:3-hydroxyisobutyrate dehydrogenase-like beta-hydroxyacid dehydrogenase
MMFAVLNAVTAEVLSTASRVGVHPEVFYECLVTSGAATVSGLFREVGAKIARHDFTPVFSVDLLCKDTDLAVGMARAAGAAPLLTEIAQVLGHTARAQGLGELDSAALVRVYEDLLTDGRQDPGDGHAQRDAGS